MKQLYKYNLKDISKLLLALLILSINVNGPDFFHTKELFFVLFIATSFQYAEYSHLYEFFIMFTVVLISCCLNLIIPGSNLTFSNILSNTLGVIYLILLIFNNDCYKNVIIKTYLFSAKCVAILIISIWCICSFNPFLKTAIIAYFESIKSDKVAFIMMIQNRKILKWWVLGVYYGTAPCMIPALGFYLIQQLNNKSKRNIVNILLLASALIMTGARANIMASGLLVLSYYGFYLIKRKYYSLALFSLMFVLFGGIIVAYAFLSDKGEASLNVKNLHKVSYLELFDTDIIRTFFYGWGAGSKFYSKGFKCFTEITELSLYETIRRYGFVSTLLIFLFIWLKPILIIFEKKHNFTSIFPIIILCAYIFVACTNPFLLGSIGFCALLFFNTYFENYNNKDSI